MGNLTKLRHSNWNSCVTLLHN